VVLFERLVWHLESPAGVVFPKVGGPAGLMRCHDSTLWGGYRKHVLHSFGLLNVPPPPIPHVLLSFRRRGAAKNTGRVFADEGALTSVLAEGNLIKVTPPRPSTLGLALSPPCQRPCRRPCQEPRF
jgi:hypothetical protein